MNKKLLILSTALFFLLRASLVKSKEIIHRCCTAEITHKETNLQFFLAHPDQCTSCTMKFTIHNDAQDSLSTWHTIKEKFTTMINACQHAEQNENDAAWAELLGFNLPTIMKITTHQNNGIHGNLSLSADDNSCSLEGTIYHDQNYRHTDWQMIISLLACYTCENTIKENSPFMSDILNLAQQSEHIHGSLELALNS